MYEKLWHIKIYVCDLQFGFYDKSLSIKFSSFNAVSHPKLWFIAQILQNYKNHPEQRFVKSGMRLVNHIVINIIY